MIRNRRSIRRFTDEPVNDEQIQKIVQQGALAPSWANAQNWKIYAASGETLKSIRKEHIARSMAGIPGDSVFPVMHRTAWPEQSQKNMALWGNEVAEWLNGDMQKFAMDNTELFDAPVILYLALPQKSVSWSVYDLGALGYGLMLAAENMNIQSMPAYETVKYPDLLQKALHVEDGWQIVMGIAIGKAADDRINTFRSQRMALNEYLTIRK